jgi:hypothetical protein
MIQHYSSRSKYITAAVASKATYTETIISAGKSYIFYGASFTGGNGQAWFTDSDGNFLWAVQHVASQPTGFTDLRFLGTDGLIVNIINQGGGTLTTHVTTYLSDTGEGVLS